MDITRVGFGAWAIGGGDWAFAWGAQDDAKSIAAIHHAVEAGINWIDTAAVYGLGHSEEVVAEALRTIPEADRPYVFTKCGMVWDKSDRSTWPKRLGNPASVRSECEDSLKRLGVERIDLYQMHWPSEDVEIESYWQVLLDLKSEGKIAAAGLSNHDVSLLERAESLGHVDSLQPPFSLINRKAAADVIPWCAAHGTGDIVYSPMQSGLLTGFYSAERAAAIPDDDWRRLSPEFKGDALIANLALADALRPIADRHGTNVASVAIAWTLGFEGVSGAIVGARSPEQIDGWLDAATLELDAQDRAELIEALKRTGAGSGPIEFS